MKIFLMVLMFCAIFYAYSFVEDELGTPIMNDTYIGTEPALSVLGCPPEDVVEYPVSEIAPPPQTNDGVLIVGWCDRLLKLSTEELRFGREGGIRCVTTSYKYVDATGNMELGCRTETVDGITFVREACPWFTLTRVSERVLHISVSQNETGRERKTPVSVTNRNCFSAFVITQSAD
jgi:hypothetical protein